MKPKIKFKKLLSILLCGAMLLGLLPSIVFAAESLTQTIEFPITKTVFQKGDVAPGWQTFEFEIFNIGNSNSEEYANVSVSSFVRTNGAGDYDTNLVIIGYEDQINAMTCEGFYVHEENTGADNWTYSDQVYSVEPVYKDGMIVRFEIYPVELTGSGDGLYYEKTQEEPLDCMVFENTYTENNPSDSSDPTESTDPFESSFPSDSTDPFESSFPSDSTDPFESSFPSDSTDPFESSFPSDSTDPFESSFPSDSTDPFESSFPSDSTDPFESSFPSDSTDPFESSFPSDSTDPFESSFPSDSTDPFESSFPSDSTDPLESSFPSDSTDPLESSNPTDSTDPLESSNPTESSEPLESSNPTGSSEPLESSNPTGSSEPTDSSDPIAPSHPIGSNDPTTPSDPTDSDEPTDSSEPTDLDEALISDETTDFSGSNGSNGDINAPQTGDDRNIFGLIAIMCVSAFGILGTTIYSKKKRES